MSLETDIAALEEALNTGATEIFVDGQKVSLSLPEIRRRLRELKRQQQPGRRPRIATIDLSGF